MAGAHKVQHDYHLVDPSPWPAVGSISAFLVAVGAIFWMHKSFAAAPLIFALGVVGVIYTMISLVAGRDPRGGTATAIIPASCSSPTATG